jgi:hypothetical protein
MFDWLVRDFTILGIQNWIAIAIAIILIGIAVAWWPRE